MYVVLFISICLLVYLFNFFLLFAFNKLKLILKTWLALKLEMGNWKRPSFSPHSHIEIYDVLV